MKALITVLASLCLAAQAGATTLLMTDSDTMTLGPGDVVDNIVMFETSYLEIHEGAIIGELTMLNHSTAKIFGGTISGDLDIIGDAELTIFGEQFKIFGFPFAGPLVQLNCPLCPLTAVVGSDLLNVDAQALENGRIVFSAVPEPLTASMFMLGLLGLAIYPSLEGRDE